MKPMDPGAGERPRRFGRRYFLKGGLASFALSALGVAADEPAVATAAGSYVGGRLLRRVDPRGFPLAGPDTFGPMTLFVFPVAVAAGPFDIYIADAGLAVLFRFDPTLDAMMVVPGVRVSEQTRIAAVQDGSVVVTEGRMGAPRRFSRTGRLMQTIDPQNTAHRFDEIVVDPVSGRYFGLDRVQHRVEEVLPLGRSSNILGDDLLPRLPSALALDKDTLYAAGQDCQCIMAIDLFRRDRQVLVEDVIQATAMAAGDGWLVVADNVERVLRIYKDRILRADPDYGALGLANPQGLSVARDKLYVADPGGRRIATFRLRP